MTSRSLLAAGFALFALHPMHLSAAPVPEPFGKMPDGRPVSLYTLSKKKGMQVRISDLGATLVSVKVPDRSGALADVTHGFDSATGYLSDENPYFGATVGRFGNRIADGKFSLDGKTFTLAKNNSPGDIPCHLHGGGIGFNKRLWRVVENDAPRAITFEYLSPDGEEGYPGQLVTRVSYSLNNKNELRWTATATTDKPTIVNIVHHPYWNLSGDPSKSINDHLLTIPASRYLPTDAGLIPTGELAGVEGTPMDFRHARRIGDRVGEKFQALEFAGGYDHCWVLDRPKSKGLAMAARLEDPGTGRVLTIRSNQPAIQFYGGNFLDGTVKGKGGVTYRHRTALCLETENFPDAPNQAGFPSSRLNPGETYKHEMLYQFRAD
jgi:aldose 1-epimerase